jgi:RimJ/RimL family protein N-acetyltransferase
VIRLEPLDRAHLDLLAAVAADPEVRRFTRVPEPVPPGFAELWLGRYEDGRREGTRVGFAIAEGDGTLVGLAFAPRLDREARTAELGYVVVREARGRGVATEALRLLTEWAFAEAGMLRLELLIAPDNNASKRVAERCGYVREGLLRSFHVKQDLREDTEIWSRLRGDP